MDLERLNSATKYPSIPTYHRLGDRGIPTEQVQVEFGDSRLIFTEKVDGTNGRLIAMPDGDWFIGSREELLTANGDRVPNPAMGLVEALRKYATTMSIIARDVTVFYFEAFGGRITAASKQYTGSGAVSSLLFDVALVPLSILEEKTKEQIAQWRDNGGQKFEDEEGLTAWASVLGATMTPRLAGPDNLPRGANAIEAVLREVTPKTLCSLDDGAGGRSEGLVVRTRTRAAIAKLRFEDYAKLNRNKRG